MLNFEKVITPQCDGEVLVVPSPHEIRQALEINRKLLAGSSAKICGFDLAELRARTREMMGLENAGPLIAIGHQPEFIHPGVWAKHIVAMRLARAVKGTAINLVVDNDAPREIALKVPVVRDARTDVQSIPAIHSRAGVALEELGRLPESAVHNFQKVAAEAIRSDAGVTQLDSFFRGMAESGAADFVDQMVSGRRTVDENLGVTLRDVRVSRIWWSPLFFDMLQNAQKFAASYNRALAEYRRAFRVRGRQRPIPDLYVGDRVELPVWAYRPGETRRRVFVRISGEAWEVFADADRLGERSAHSASPEILEQNLMSWHPWKLRPRALALTMWARLLLADFFIHGIGGAKYDRVSDAIMQDYFGINPPHMGCVSATLRLDLQTYTGLAEELHAAKRKLRDLRWNPQRYVQMTDKTLLLEKHGMMERLDFLRQHHRRDRNARRAGFLRLRQINETLFRDAIEEQNLTDRRIRVLKEQARSQQAALNREYFFGLFPETKLRKLMDALPQESDFRL